MKPAKPTTTRDKRKNRSLRNKTRHAGVSIRPDAEIDEIMRDIAEQADHAPEGVDRARVHALRLTGADLRARLLQRAQDAGESLSPEETETEAVNFLEARGWTCTRPSRSV